MADGMSRRRMLATSAAGMGLALAADAPAAPRAKVESVTVISKQPHLYHGWPRERLDAWRAARDRLPPAERRKDLGVWMLRSADGGRTWSARYDCLVNSPHGPVRLGDGRLLYAGRQLWRARERVGVCESTD